MYQNTQYIAILYLSEYRETNDATNNILYHQ